MTKTFKPGDLVTMNRAWLSSNGSNPADKNARGRVTDHGEPVEGSGTNYGVRWDTAAGTCIGEQRVYAGFLERIAESGSNGHNFALGALTPEQAQEAVSGFCTDAQGVSAGVDLAHGERMDEYGHPKVSFDRIAALWSDYLSAPEIDPENLSAENVGALMILLKVSRTITDRKADTLDDIEGYVECIRMLRDAE